MKTPAHLGLPERYSSWRRGQDQALLRLLHSTSRFNALVPPTGSGKTVIYMSFASLHQEERVLCLTSTKAMMDQLSGEFGEMGLVDVRGRANYTCDMDEDRTAETAPCTGGAFCELMNGGCAYYDRVRTAEESQLVSTNYAYWMFAEKTGNLGYFKTLILDEAHLAPQELSDYAAVEISTSELRRFELPPPDRGRIKWWGPSSIERLEGEAKIGPFDKRRQARRLADRIARLCRLSEERWLFTKTGGKRSEGAYRWDLIDPSVLAESLLFRRAQRVVLVSASLRRKTLGLLGVDGRSEDRIKMFEQASTFPVARRPVYYYPVARMNYKSSEEDKTEIIAAMDDFIGRRLDRKGIVHSVSYKRAEEIVSASKLGERVMLLHRKSDDFPDVLRRFRQHDPPCVLVSPAASTGLNFPYEEVEFQVIPKIPYPDLSSPIIKVRAERDQEYVPYLAWQALVQSVGRGMRAPDDQCETAVFDAAFGMLRGRYWSLAPDWFHVAVRTIDRAGGERIPNPPPPLRQQ